MQKTETQNPKVQIEKQIWFREKTLASCVWVVAVLRKRCNKDEVHLVFSLLEPPSWRNLNYHHQYNFHSNIPWAPQISLEHRSSTSHITPASQISLKHLKYHLKFELNTPKLRYVPCCDIYSFGFTRTGLIAFLHSLWLWQCLNKQTHPHFCHQLFLLLQLSTGKQKIKYTTPNIRYTMPNLAEQST